jgi:hypothetical protein
MRSMLLIGLALLGFSEAFGADEPIPQDAARMAKRRQDRLDWYRRTSVGAYDKVGKKNPRWDKPAREAMDLASRMLNPQDGPPITVVDVHRVAKAAVDAGCDDPLLVNIYERSWPGKRDEEFVRRMTASAKALAASRYPVFRRAGGLEAVGTLILDAKAPDDGSKKVATQHFEAALRLLAESVATDERNEFWEDSWFEIIKRLFRGYRNLGIDSVASIEKIDAEVARIPELQAFRLEIYGGFVYTYAWEARTNALAPEVPAGNMVAFKERLADAQKVLNDAWKLRPNARIAEWLLEIEKGIGGDRAKMELWFDRAMKANGDSRAACFSKLDWLDPKWRGTNEEMLAFGRACGQTKNWRAGITLLAVDAHLRYYQTLAPNLQFRYWSKPEVWSEVKSINDEYLSHYPSDNVARSKYAAICYLAGKYLESQDQFKILGDGLTSWTESPIIPLEKLKQMRNLASVRGANTPR